MPYLDNASTTKLTPAVKSYITEILDIWGNPSSVHSKGQYARELIQISRKNTAEFIHTNESNILFTSSGSASNCLAIKGSDDKQHIFLYSPTAHKSMIKCCQSCLNEALKVDNNGVIDLIYLKNRLSFYSDKTKIVCLEAANSEIGTIQNINEISDLVHLHNGFLIVDCTGYIPCIEVDVQNFNADILTFSGHKLNSLKGVGVLYKRPEIHLLPLIYGSQEEGLFAGTENVLGIASLGKAVENYSYSSVTTKNRDYLYKKITENVSDCYIIGSMANRLPHNLYMCFKRVSGESLMIMLDKNDIQVSTGSACTSGDLAPSPTLTAIGICDKDINSCIRFSLSGNETYEELDYVVRCVKENVERLRFLNN